MSIISAVANTKLYIGDVTAGQEQSDYEAVDPWTEVKDLADIGEFGDEANIIEYETIDDARVKKAVGTRNAGDLSVTVARMEDDAGQVAMRAAAKTSNHYDFKMVLSNGEIFYFTGPISSARNQLGGANDVTQTVFTVAISSGVLEPT
ncbi:phage tail tube protein [Hoeflea sp. CAU 1731]